MNWSVKATLPENYIISLRTWGSYLYAGCSNGKVYRSSDGTAWNLVWTDVSGSIYGIYDLKLFGSYFYAIDFNGRISRTNDGTAWANVEDLSGSTYGWALHVHGSNIYAIGGSGPQVFRSSDGLTWDIVLSIGGDHLFAATTFGSYMYTVLDATTTDNGAIYRSMSGDLGDWAIVLLLNPGPSTFEDQCRSMIVFNGYLYLNIYGTIRRTLNGTDYTTVGAADGDGIGAVIFNNTLYMNARVAASVHKTANGTTWEEDVDLSAEPGVTSVFGMEEFQNELYMGTRDTGKLYVRDADPIVSLGTLPSEFWNWRGIW